MCQDYTGRWWEDSCGSDHTESCDYHGALDGAAKIKCDRFFAVGIGLSTDSVYTEDTDWGQDLDLTGEELLEKVAEEVQALPEYKQVVNVTDGDSLNDVFAGIAGSNQLIINKLHGNEFAPGVVAKGVWRKPEKH